MSVTNSFFDEHVITSAKCVILYGTDGASVCRSVMEVLILHDSMPCGVQLTAATLSMGVMPFLCFL